MSCSTHLTVLKTVMFVVPQGSVLEPMLFSLFINDLPLHVKHISVGCDMFADDTRLHTSGKDHLQIRSNIQDSLDQVSSGCDNNHIVINNKIMSLHKQLGYNKGCSCAGSLTMRPQSI